MTSSSGLSDEKLTALSSVYVSCLSLSLIGSCSVIVVTILKQRNLKEQAKPLFQLALADFLATFVLFLTTLINLSPKVVHKSELLCSDGLPLSLTFYCISFLLVIIYAFKSAHTAQGWREQGQEEYSRQYRRCTLDHLYIFAWILPVIGYVVYISSITFPLSFVISNPLEGFSYEESGWYNSSFCNSCILFLHLHIEDTLCSTVLVYWKFQSWYRHFEQDGRRCVGRVWSSASYMILVIIFCWTPALIVIGVSFVYSNTERLFPLFVIQAISVSLQGFLNSIVYGWRRRNFREAVFTERLHLLSYVNQAFYDQSLALERENEENSHSAR
ncbi:uncharacterized protein si:dkey-30c15.2 [Trichomycterus rosablanca]|uniref:uncharacterized protein si:dkey-30c15.2 n=1 Tax=Trichomycterus rosablanca TaxID=2290929 RepID=UPI002F35C146